MLAVSRGSTELILLYSVDEKIRNIMMTFKSIEGEMRGFHREGNKDV